MPRYTTSLNEYAGRSIQVMLGQMGLANRVAVERALNLRRNAGRKETTNRNYVRALLDADRLLDGKAIVEASADDLLRVVASFRATGGAGYLHTRCVNLAAFIKQQRGLRPQDALPRELDDVLRVPRSKRKSPGYRLTDDDWKRLLEAAAEPEDWFAERDLAMLWTDFDVGFRPSELLSLTWAKRRWLDQEVGELRLVEGEGDLKTGVRSEPTAFGICAPQLKVWEELHGAAGVPAAPMWPAFKSRPTGQPLTYSAWNKRLKQLANKAGIVVPSGKGLRAHDLRHTAASRDALDLNFPETALRAKYGWSPGSKEMAVYLHMRENAMRERAREAARRTHGVSPLGYSTQPSTVAPVEQLAHAIVKALELVQQRPQPAPSTA